MKRLTCLFLAALALGGVIFVTAHDSYIREGCLAMAGGAFAVALGFSESNKLLCVFVATAYTCVGLALSFVVETHGLFFFWNIETCVRIVVEVFCVVILLVCAGSYIQKRFMTSHLQQLSLLQTWSSVKKNREQGLVYAISAFALCYLLYCCIAINVDLKAREIGLLVTGGISAVLFGYLGKDRILSSILLSVYLTVGMILPRHLCGRTARKGEFDKATVLMYLTLLCVSLVLVYSGYVFKRLRARCRRRPQ